MALLPIIKAPDARLKLRAAPVGRVTPEVRRLMDDLLETMYAAVGVGLAAPQVGILQRVVVVDIAKGEEAPRPLCLADPEVLWRSPELAEYEEGCLSFPEQYSEVARPARVRVRFLDAEGERREIAAEGLLATCLQHEIDHLHGITFVDHISALKRNIILRRLRKTRRLEEAAAAAE